MLDMPTLPDMCKDQVLDIHVDINKHTHLETNRHCLVEVYLLVVMYMYVMKLMLQFSKTVWTSMQSSLC